MGGFFANDLAYLTWLHRMNSEQNTVGNVQEVISTLLLAESVAETFK